MERALCLAAIALSACQAQSADRGQSSSPASDSATDRIYVQDASGSRMVEIDWTGTILGSVSAAGFVAPSGDGSKFLRSGDQGSIEDWRGHRLSGFDWGLSSYGMPIWADDDAHLCGVEFPANAGSDLSKGSVWILVPGQKPRIVASVDVAGSAPAVEACSVSGNRIVIAAGASPHWPPGGTRYLISTEVTVLNLTTGAIDYHHVYPQGNMGGQLDVGPRGDWVLVTPSPDGRYLAETAVFTNSTAIRDVATGQIVASVAGTVTGFSSDGSRVVDVLSSGGVGEVQVMTWADQHVIWRTAGGSAGVLQRPGSSDLLIGIGNAAGSSDLYVLTGSKAVVIAANAFLQWMCPCYPGS